LRQQHPDQSDYSGRRIPAAEQLKWSVSMKTLNDFIQNYTDHLRQGEIQVAYKGIFEFLGRLRSDCIKKYPSCEIGSIYPGYMDMSYFSLSTKALKDKGLKVAIVYLHEKGAFELWLSARNREIAAKSRALFREKLSDMKLFHDDRNPDAIMEYPLLSMPDFDDQDVLIERIEQGIEQFLARIENLL
jgi:hypothetical protein